MKRIFAVMLALAGVLFSGACKKMTGAAGAPEVAPETAPASARPWNPATEAQQIAVQRYPELANKESLFNRTFRALYEDRKKTEPQLFAREDWPLVLADRVGKILQVKPKKRAGETETALAENR